MKKCGGRKEEEEEVVVEEEILLAWPRVCTDTQRQPLAKERERASTPPPIAHGLAHSNATAFTWRTAPAAAVPHVHALAADGGGGGGGVCAFI